MTSDKKQFCLASASPRRRDILGGLGYHFFQHSSNVDEALLKGESPEDYVIRLALSKATAAHSFGQHDSLPVLGADTCVVFDGRIMGKPADFHESRAMLRQLSGQWHEVFSAVCVKSGEKLLNGISVSRVRFRNVSDDEIRAYWLSGEPEDKAGSYAIQGLAGIFVERLEGSYSGVVGLPVFETVNLLAEFDIKPDFLMSGA